MAFAPRYRSGVAGIVAQHVCPGVHSALNRLDSLLDLWLDRDIATYLDIRLVQVLGRAGSSMTFTIVR